MKSIFPTCSLSNIDLIGQALVTRLNNERGIRWVVIFDCGPRWSEASTAWLIPNSSPSSYLAEDLAGLSPLYSLNLTAISERVGQDVRITLLYWIQGQRNSF